MDAAEQMPIVEAFVQQGVKGIAVSVINPKGQKKDLTRIASEVPLITMDNDADPETGRLCYVGVDNMEAGRAVGRLVKKCLPERRDDRHVHRQRRIRPTARPAREGCSTNSPARGPDGHQRRAPSTGNRLNGKMYGKYFLVDGEPKTDGGPEKNPEQHAARDARPAGERARMCA